MMHFQTNIIFISSYYRMQMFTTFVKINALEINLYSEFKSATPLVQNLCDDNGKGKGKFNPRTGHKGP